MKPTKKRNKKAKKPPAQRPTAAKHKSVSPEEDLYILIRKSQFDAVRDGIPRLREQPLRRMAAYWLGSERGMIEPLDDLLAELQEAMNSPVKLGYVMDRLPKRSVDLLYYVLSEGGVLAYDELQAGFPVREKEDLRIILQPLAVSGLIWDVRAAAQEEEYSAVLPSVNLRGRLESFFLSGGQAGCRPSAQIEAPARRAGRPNGW